MYGPIHPESNQGRGRRPGAPWRPSFFASDLHGSLARYRALLSAVERERPPALFLGGDLLPHPLSRDPEYAGGFLAGFLRPELARLRERMGAEYPVIFAIPGNDDSRSEEPELAEAERGGLLVRAHGRSRAWGAYTVYGYAFVPPTPFGLKDWERYDVSRFTDPGCTPPTEGWRSVPGGEREAAAATIREDLERLAGQAPMERAIFLFHAPPYGGDLDRAALDGRAVDGVPLDVHVGSIAIRRFIEARQPLMTLHGHVHESAAITGRWRERLGRTLACSAAHDGPELALVRFDPREPVRAERELLG